MDTNEYDISKLIQQGESLQLEFKSDLKCLSDRELVATVGSLSNMELCHLDLNQAYRLLTRIKEYVQIKQIGEHKGAVYELV